MSGIVVFIIGLLCFVLTIGYNNMKDRENKNDKDDKNT